MHVITFAETRQWINALMLIGFVMALLLCCTSAFASEGTEFAASAKTFEGWVKGNLGKTAALVCVAVGIFVAAARKDLSWFLYSVVIALGVGIIVSIINASFTATI